ncbi:MAG TPA: YeeE/YedE thiosulfate transporter family protein [Thermoanaerobaculaceae bacterium]|nr:YeeE/YedE thiosulfate transporter family protein [Thermoanaerobaculaceae bacterium]HRS15096.1 YeeE/YedE thiosulfate transporter family protein [Thermoanaerobaculaceae bacterium]
MNRQPKNYLNPYLAGVLLGVVLTASFLVFGHGLGASGGVALLTGVAQSALLPAHAERNPYLVNLVVSPERPLDNWTVFEVLGVLLGGLASGWLSGRVRVETFRGPHVSARARWGYAFVGGGIAGFGVRLARGCTSSQALSGGAVLSAGSWAFMFAVFGGAYLLAYFVRRLWI